MRFSGHSQKTICRYSAILVYAFRGSLLEGAGSAVLFRRDWRSFDFGFCFALGLTILRGFRRGDCVALKTCATQCNTPSDPAQNRAPAHLWCNYQPSRTNQQNSDLAPWPPRRGRLKRHKSQFIFSPQSSKSLFIFPRNRVNRRLYVRITK